MKTLDNGVTVLLIPDHSAPIISCQVYSRLGTRDEPADAAGSAFLVGRSALGRVDWGYREGTGLILEDDETASAVVNHDFVGLLLRGSIDKLDSMVERASSFASYDSLNRGFAQKYKTVQDQSAIESSHIAGAGESLRTYTYDRLFETAYGNDGNGHSLTGGEFGAKLTESAFLKFVAEAGAPVRLLVVIAGDIEPTYTMLLANRWFGHRRAVEAPVNRKVSSLGPTPGITKSDEKPKPAARLDLKLPTRDDVLAIGYRVPGADNPDTAALTVLAAILGGGQSSILGNRFLTRDSADFRASELSCRLGPYGTTKSASLFAVYLRETVSPYYSIWQSEKFINDEIAKLRQTLVDPQQLITAKKLLLGEFRRRTESIDGRASAVSQAFLRTGDTTWIDNYVSSIQAVSANDVMKIASRYLVDANRAGVTIVSVPTDRAGN